MIGYRRVIVMTDLNQLELADLFSRLVRGDHLDDLLRIAVEEDHGTCGDVTTSSHPDPSRTIGAVIRSRETGVLAGVPVLDRLLSQHAPRLSCWWKLDDGSRIRPGDVVCRLSGALIDLLPIERILLNMLGRLSGVASTTARFVDAVDGHPARICDTRKTTPGYRTLEKYAVRCGGGCLHRIGLYDAFLLKDNHLGGHAPGEFASLVHEAVRTARSRHELSFAEVEVDTLEQMRQVLTSNDGGSVEDLIDILLLDNMDPGELREAVAWRDRNAPRVLLEASGGVSLTTVADIGATGVDRIAVGAITHSAVQVDFGMDLE